MPITIKKSELSSEPRNGNVAYLRSNNWDDYGFKTLFHLWVIDELGNRYDIGDVKIGFADQPNDTWTDSAFNGSFEEFDDSFFSVGQDVSYYQAIYSLPQDLAEDLLHALKDVVHSPASMELAMSTEVFHTSLIRSVPLTTINEQFSRALEGRATLTEFNFNYVKGLAQDSAGINLSFRVTPNSLPPTNIHALIGRNGIGKTTLLNNMIMRLAGNSAQDSDYGDFYEIKNERQYLNNKYFTNVVSVSFSAFDPFPPPDSDEQDSVVKYKYIGLKSTDITSSRDSTIFHKDIHDLAHDFLQSLNSCLSLQQKKKRWVQAIKSLETDNNFAELNLSLLADEQAGDLRDRIALDLYKTLSSGHAIVLLTLSRLVERIEERSLVLIDEPESHLHPPLLSAFIRALSTLLTNRNGVAIIATHSPVILQEVPKKCVWKLRRTGLIFEADRPDSETFSENVGILTRDVFGLEVAASGFHAILKHAANSNKTYDEIVADFDGQIGYEGRAMLRSFLKIRSLG